jgi:hypothetical protein
MGEYRAAVAGESFRNEDGSDRQTEIAKCKVGETITLEREPDNQHDRNCIRVISARGVQIGNIARDGAQWMAERMDRGHPVTATIDSIGRGEGWNLGVVLSVSTDYDQPDPRPQAEPMPQQAAAGSITYIDRSQRPDLKGREWNRKGCWWVLGIISALIILSIVNAPSREEQNARDAKQATEQKAADDAAAADAAKKSAAAEGERQNGFHCLSAWDGSNRSLVQQVKANLRDPDSFEHEETRITPENKGKHVVIMKYRAKNGFGGYNVATAIGTVDARTCDATLVTIGE